MSGMSIWLPKLFPIHLMFAGYPCGCCPAYSGDGCDESSFADDFSTLKGGWTAGDQYWSRADNEMRYGGGVPSQHAPEDYTRCVNDLDTYSSFSVAADVAANELPYPNGPGIAGIMMRNLDWFAAMHHWGNTSYIYLDLANALIMYGVSHDPDPYDQFKMVFTETETAGFYDVDFQVEGVSIHTVQDWYGAAYVGHTTVRHGLSAWWNHQGNDSYSKFDNYSLTLTA
jgi:hypothetical protein